MKTYLELKDIENMVQATTCFRDALLIRLLSRLGCRISEALSLTTDDIDVVTAQMTIIHLKIRTNMCCVNCDTRLSKAHHFCPACGKSINQATMKEQEHRKFRTLPIDAETLDMLRDYINRGGPVSKSGKRYIFGINRHRAWQIVRDCAVKAALPQLVNPDTGRTRGISPHRLRDAFSVHAMKSDDSGDGLRLLQQHLGHASFDTTAKYRKIAGEEHREWYEKLWQEK